MVREVSNLHENLEGLLDCCLFGSGTNNGIHENSLGNQVLVHSALAGMSKSVGKAGCLKDS